MIVDDDRRAMLASARRDDRHRASARSRRHSRPHAAASLRRQVPRSWGRRSLSPCSRAIESLLSAVVADGMIGGPHRSNMELVAQGIANIVVAAVRRHARHRRHRAHRDQRQERRTHADRRHHPRAHAAAHHRVLRPLRRGSVATLGGDSRRRRVSHERVAHVPLRAASPKSDVAVLLTTFALTVLVDLTVASRSAWCSPHSCSFAAWPP